MPATLKKLPKKQLKPGSVEARFRAKALVQPEDPRAEPLERLDLIEEATELRSLGYTYETIAKKVAEKFSLVPVPSTVSAYNWVKRGFAFRAMTLAERQEDVIKDGLANLDKQLERWSPTAAGKKLCILRKKIVDGVEIDVLDEDAYDEQIKAANLVAKLIALKGTLVGAGKVAKEESETLDASKMLNLVMNVNQYIHIKGAPEPKTIEIEGERLELESGLEHLDKL